MKMQPNSNKEDKHNLTFDCFSKCTEWKLSLNIKTTEISSSIVYISNYIKTLTAKSSFHRKIELSILNSFQTKDIKENKSENHSIIKEINDKNLSDENIELKNTVFPLNNTKDGFVILESNLNKTENLNNIVFIEFDLKNSKIPIEKLKPFYEINNDFVDKEIIFRLNATIHGKNIFEKDIQFTVESRLFIKSIQFRIESHRKHKQTKKDNKNLLFTKIHSNQNIGIEVYKKNISEISNTNFNSIVNSNIVINKIFLELRIPDSLLFIDTQDKNISFTEQNTSKIFFQKQAVNIEFQKQNEFFRRTLPSKIHPSLVFFNNPLLQYNIHSNFVDVKQSAIFDPFHRVNLSQITNPVFLNNPYTIHPLRQNYLNIQQNKSYSNIVNPHLHKKFQFIQMLIKFYEGQCNFFIFIKAVKPYIHISNTECLRKNNIFQFFENFTKVSVFGLDVTYLYENEIVNVNYSPTLSSIEIVITDNSTLENFLRKMNKEEYLLQKNVNKVLEIFFGENCKLRYFKGKLVIEYDQHKPTYSRQIFSEQINTLFKSIPGLNEILIPNVYEKSWFSIMWTVSKSSNAKFVNTSFLVFYQFQLVDIPYLNIHQNYQFLEIPIIGILPINLDDSVWLTRIYNSVVQGYCRVYDNMEFRIILSKSIENVHFLVINRIGRLLYDYNVYANSKK